jgi:hypothetical protein
VTFNVLYGFVVLLHNRRQVVHFNATAHPTALWTAQQIIEAFPEVTVPGLEFRVYADQRAGLVLRTYKGKVYQINYVACAQDKHRCLDYYENLSEFVRVVTHCPPVPLECPHGPVKAGYRIILRASVTNDPKMTLTWVLNAGKIVGPQGDQTISVDTAAIEGQTLRVTVQARGSCSVETSCEVPVIQRNPY